MATITIRRHPVNSWSHDQIERLIFFKDKGHSWEFISTETGKSISACRNKYRREKGIIK